MKYKPRVFADTKDMGREEWLEQRKKGIGGSDASSIMGLNPYSSPLKVYLDKIGKGEDKVTTEAMRQGTDLEQYVAERFCEETGLQVRRCNQILQHPKYDWMLANVDRLIVGHNAGLECKTTSPYSKFKFDEGEINPHYYWQSIHYLAVTGADVWYVAVLVLGKAFHVFEIRRDESAIRQLIDAEKEFWEEHVLKKDPPLPTGSEVDDEAVAAVYPEGDDAEEDVELFDIDNILDLRNLTLKRREEIDAEIREYDQQIKMAMGKHVHGYTNKWKVNWSNTSTSRVDAKLLKEKYPEIAAEVTKTTTGRRFSVSRLREAL